MSRYPTDIRCLICTTLHPHSKEQPSFHTLIWCGHTTRSLLPPRMCRKQQSQRRLVCLSFYACLSACATQLKHFNDSSMRSCVILISVMAILMTCLLLVPPHRNICSTCEWCYSISSNTASSSIQQSVSLVSHHWNFWDTSWTHPAFVHWRTR